MGNAVTKKKNEKHGKEHEGGHLLLGGPGPRLPARRTNLDRRTGTSPGPQEREKTHWSDYLQGSTVIGI